MKYLILDKVSAAHESPCLLRDRIFQFTKESVAKLKARANKEVVESKGQISSLQAVIAHVWRSIIRCHSAMNSGTQETTFEIPIGARQRLNPPLPEEYFGNSVFPARSGRANSFDGRITIYGGFEKGSMEIEACLFPETLSALVNDAEFMEFVKSDF
ncbi:protein ENHANCEDSUSCEPTIBILITY 1 [Sesamum angolense]|uniref:Protein ENHANCEDSUSCEPTIBILITY 1 n=1 Tax=Sesamum angolense TaxID=2727404 RepID=A0AAE1WBY6_9LAMI|nr:protein ENHANCEDSUSCEPTIBILITY 1 [Sesamum angolense]